MNGHVFALCELYVVPGRFAWMTIQEEASRKELERHEQRLMAQLADINTLMQRRKEAERNVVQVWFDAFLIYLQHAVDAANTAANCGVKLGC